MPVAHFSNRTQHRLRQAEFSEQRARCLFADRSGHCDRRVFSRFRRGGRGIVQVRSSRWLMAALRRNARAEAASRRSARNERGIRSKSLKVKFIAPLRERGTRLRNPSQPGHIAATLRGEGARMVNRMVPSSMPTDRAGGTWPYGRRSGRATKSRQCTGLGWFRLSVVPWSAGLLLPASGSTTIRRRATIRPLQPTTARHRGLTCHRRRSPRRLISPARPERQFVRWSTPLHTALPAIAPRPRAGCGVAQHDGRSSRGRLARGSAGQSSRSAARRQTEPYGAN